MSPAPILISTLYHYPISILNHCYPMPYIHPNASTEELVHTAITTSVRESRVYHLHYTPELAAALARECEGEADYPEAREFWGVDLDGNTWRVHLDREDT